MRLIAFCVLMSAMPAFGTEPEQSQSPESAFWTRIALGIGRPARCDSFGKYGTECQSATVGTAAVSLGGASWQVEAGGFFQRRPLDGWHAHASAAGQLFAAGPVRIGAGLEFTEDRWNRTVYRSEQTTLGTSRIARAGLGGLNIGPGRIDRRHARATMLVGYYQSTYRGTFDVAGHHGREVLAEDHFPLVGVRLGGGNIPLGARTLVSGSVQHIRYVTGLGSVETRSPAVPSSQWSGMFDVSWRAARRGERTRIDIFLRADIAARNPSLIAHPSLELGAAWRFR